MDREAITRAVEERAFRDTDEDGMPKAEAFGWVAIHDPLVTDFDATDLFFQQYLVVGFRFDTRAVPAKLSWMERRRQEDVRRREQDLEKLSRDMKREIKQDVESNLMSRALPNPKLFECAWNLETEALYFTGKLKSARETFASLFRETFGVAPIPMIPYLAAERVGLPDGIVDSVRGVEPSHLGPDAAEESWNEAPAPVAAAPISLRSVAAEAISSETAATEAEAVAREAAAAVVGEAATTEAEPRTGEAATTEAEPATAEASADGATTEAEPTERASTEQA